MNKRVKIYLGIFVILIGLIIFFENGSEKNINWFPTYNKSHKIPYGTFVLFNELPKLFSKSEVITIDKPPYIYLQGQDITGLYLFINQNIDFGKDEFNELLSFVSRGNQVFISSNTFNLDTIGIITEHFIPNSVNDSAFFKLTNKTFGDKKYNWDRSINLYKFRDSVKYESTSLGQIIFENEIDSTIQIGSNYLKMKYGKGTFYFHTFPEAFTNYFILKNKNSTYTSNILSYLTDNKTILWDSFHKTGKKHYQSPLHFLLSNKSLKWSYYFLLLGILIYILFEGKRKQRSIKIIKPLPNKTLAFTRTIANMYYEKSDNKSICTQKLNYFYEYIRSQYNIDTSIIDEKFKIKFAEKVGINIKKSNDIFSFFESLQKKDIVSIDELIKLEKIIHKYKY